jgi:CubicO group peptidase (beta-lactamase class C family)
MSNLMRHLANQTGWVFLLVFLLPVPSTAQGLESRVDSMMQEAIRSKAFPGAVLLVKHRDSVLLKKSFGYHTYDSLRPVASHHLYDLASITKVSAATLAVMKLYEQGKIELDQPIKRYIPGFGWNKRGKSTLRELLSHQAGWRSWIPYYQTLKRKNGNWKKRWIRSDSTEKYPLKLSEGLYAKANIYQYLKRKIRRASFEPEQGYVYSGLFFYLIPEMVECLTDTTYQDYLNHHFYQPLSLDSLLFQPLQRYDPSIIAPTEVDTFFRMAPIHGVVHDEGAIFMNGVSGNAGLFGTADDLARLWEMLLGNGLIDGELYLQPETIRLFTTAQSPARNNRRGLGFDKPLLEYDAIKSSVAASAHFSSYGHTGYTGSLIWADPSHELLFVFLTNRVYPSRNQRKLYELNFRPNLMQLCYDFIEAPPTDLSTSDND